MVNEAKPQKPLPGAAARSEVEEAGASNAGNAGALSWKPAAAGYEFTTRNSSQKLEPPGTLPVLPGSVVRCFIQTATR